MFLTVCVLCSLRLLLLKTEGKQYQSKTLTSPNSCRTVIKILASHRPLNILGTVVFDSVMSFSTHIKLQVKLSPFCVAIDERLYKHLRNSSIFKIVRHGQKPKYSETSLQRTYFSRPLPSVTWTIYCVLFSSEYLFSLS